VLLRISAPGGRATLSDRMPAIPILNMHVVGSRFLVSGQFTQARDRILRFGGEVVPTHAFARLRW
jgi:hypothetical protein